MAFVPSVQALIGANTPHNNSNVQCAPNWLAATTYIYGPHPVSGNLYLAAQSNSGVETGSQDASAYLGGGAFHEFPVGLDQDGNIYICNLAGTVAQINPVTLTQIQQAASGLDLAQGAMSSITALNGSKWVLLKGPGAQVFFSYYTVIKETDLSNWAPGAIFWGNYSASCCPGLLGLGIGWVIVGPNNNADLQQADLHKVDVNTPGAHRTVVGSVLPTGIDAAWTEIYQNGLCIDQADGHILALFTGQAGAANPVYLAKISSVDASVIWATAMPLPNPQGIGGLMMQYSQVYNSRFYYVVNQGGGAGLEAVVVNTATGAVTDDYTVGLSHGLRFSSWASNDLLGAVMFNMSLSVGAGGPVLRNSTPAAFSGWSLLYVAEVIVPPAPPVTRRFLQSIGPSQIRA